MDSLWLLSEVLRYWPAAAYTLAVYLLIRSILTTRR